MRQWQRWVLAGAINLLAACGGGGDAQGPGAMAPPTAVAASIQIDQTGLLLTGAGETAQLSASLRDSTGQPLAASVSWESTRPGVVAVDSSGRVSAQSAAGSAQIVARTGALVSPPLLVVVSAPAAGVQLVPDEQIEGLPEDTDPDAAPSRANTYYVTYGATATLPAVGVRLLGTGSKPLGGEVLAVDAATRRVTLRPLPLRLLLPKLQIDEVIDLSQVEPLFPDALLAAYTVTKVGQRYDFVPKPRTAQGVAGGRE